MEQIWIANPSLFIAYQQGVFCFGLSAAFLAAEEACHQRAPFNHLPGGDLFWAWCAI